MNVFTIIALAFAPGIFWLWYFYKKDKLEPEPRALVAKTFFFGILATIPAVILETPFRQSKLLMLVFVAPIAEELCKFFTVRWTMYKNDEFDEPMDGIVYGTAAALGFASAENVLYLLGAFFIPEEVYQGAKSTEALWTVFTLRAFLSVPGHALWGAIWGYALGRAKFSEPEHGRSLILKGVLLAMVLHGIFNFLLLYTLHTAIGMLVLVPMVWRMVNQRIAKALESSPFRAESPPEEPADE